MVLALQLCKATLSNMQQEISEDVSRMLKTKLPNKINRGFKIKNKI